MVVDLSGQSTGVTSGSSPVWTKYRSHKWWQPYLGKAQKSLVVAALSGQITGVTSGGSSVWTEYRSH